MSAARCLVNGRQAGVDPADRGLAYGDGLFETMAVRGGVVRRRRYHRERMAEGCDRLGIPRPDWDVVLREITQLLGGAYDAVAKLIVTRGGGARGYRPPQRPVPARIVSVSPWPDHPASHYTLGVAVRTCSVRLAENPQLAGLKHLCRLEQVLAQMELASGGVDEGLVLDASGYVAGGISSNVFAVRGRELLTPALTRCGVKGVMRRVVLEAARELELEPVECDVEPTALHEADEVFITNAVFGVKPVRTLDGHSLQAGPVARALIEGLQGRGDV